MKKIGLAVGALVVIVLLLGGHWAYDTFAFELPKYPPTDKTVWLDQNWTAEQRDWFHHADQGTQTFGIPYEWFMALEQPSFSFTAPGLLSDPLYLDRYGFIPSNTNSSKPELPIGFAHSGPMRFANSAPWRNPQTNMDMTAVGLTCAACHTGRITYGKTSILIDGAPALTNLHKFQEGFFWSVSFTRFLPSRFNRFADRVLGPGASDEARSILRTQLAQVWSELNAIRKLDKKVEPQTVEEGYGRTDALNRIGNIVFSVDLHNDDNYRGYSAPVHFPRIWNASWFEWVQYNGSIRQPMARNAGEALGVGAWVNLTGGKDELFTSGLQVKTLVELEQLLAGVPPNSYTGFNGLNSPKWPTNILPPINADLAAKGAGLYKELCQSCHMVPITDNEFWTSKRWLPPNSVGERYLNLVQIPIERIGTDPAQAEDMMNRRVVTPPILGITNDQFGPALGQVIDMTVKHWYDSQQPPISEALREQMNGNRPSGPDGLVAPLAYKVRPLNGIWATPPYLHNGSVPNLYALLSPVAERPKKFYLGNREYDPVNVGYRSDKFPGDFEFDTTIRGNSNFGHEFNDTKNKNGVIGRLLSPDERRALIEYLKTL